MAALYAIWKRLSHVRLDDVHYDICGKQRGDGRFTVAWVCLACCEQGPPIPAGETLERAVSFAHIGLRAHHGLVHGRMCDHDADGLTPRTDGRSPDVSRKRARKGATYSQLCAAFEKLCIANAMVHSCKGYEAGSKTTTEEFAAARREWNESACNLDAALQAYAAELRERAGAINAQVQSPAATPAIQSAAATRR
jgi:hypothetical protein